MGLLYNTKKKTDLVVLSEEKLENNEGELTDFVLIPTEESSLQPKGDDKDDPSSAKSE